MKTQYNQAQAFVNENESYLTQYLISKASEFLDKNFDMSLDIPITLNGRLKRSLGRFRSYSSGKSINIEMSKQILIDARIKGNMDKALDVLYHELVHYALFEKRIPHSDNDYEFINECNNLGVSLTNTISVVAKVHIYECENGHKITRSRRFNHNNYLCQCKGKISYKEEGVR